jgi:hypothetical protein
VALLAGCVAQPQPQESGLLAGAQRVLALDFGTKTSSSLMRDWRQMPSAFAGEFGRAQSALHLTGRDTLPGAASSELMRSKRFSSHLLRGLEAEASRRPGYPHGLWPTSFQFAQNTANSIDTIGQLLGAHRRPMSESSDYEHRTDHTDQRPELTFWERVLRRLPL